MHRRCAGKQRAGRVIPEAGRELSGSEEPHLRRKTIAQLARRVGEKEVNLAARGEEAVRKVDDPPLCSPALERLKQHRDSLRLGGHVAQPLFTSASLSDSLGNIVPPMEVTKVLRPLDIWRTAIIRAPAERLTQSDLTSDKIVWLPKEDDRFTFRADPFGLWHDGKLHIFVERFDYRILKGEIEVLIFDRELRFLSSGIALEKPWHLSYPFVFRDGDDILMLPEASRSGQLTIYRARAFPLKWEPAAVIDVEADAVDATPLRHEGRWWLFYALIAGDRPSCALHVAFADRVTGPWQAHPANPVRAGLAGTRPAGNPIVRDGFIELPVQDGSRTYGGAVRKLTIQRLDETHFEAACVSWLEPSPALSPFDAGLHTISAAGDISLIDCKRIERSLAGALARHRGKLQRRRRQRSGAEVSR